VLHILLYKNPKFSVEVAKYLGFNTPIVIKTTKNIPMPLTYYFDNWNSLNDSQKELFNSLSPEIIRKFVGGLTFEQLNSLVNKLNPEQIQKITESLTPEQMDTISGYKGGKIIDKLIKNAGTLAQRSFGRRRKRRNRRRSKRKSNRARKT
jgi:hypothetical protein